jgi:hypothetical protein
MESIKILGRFLLINLLFYGLGSFIAFDWNPLHWWLLSTWGGRVVFLFGEMCILENT